MTLTKAQIVKNVAFENGFTKNRSIEVVKTLIEHIKSCLASGDDVLISGFGKFCVKEKGWRKGRNPATGKDMMLHSRKIVTFKCSSKLRKRINDV